MNRAKSIIVVMHVLLSVLFLLLATGPGLTQARGNRDPRGMAGMSGLLQRPTATGPHTFYPTKMSQVPREMTRRNYVRRGRAPGDQAVVRQTVLLTKLDPSIQFSYAPAPSQDAHPYWTNDEKYIFFDSNRISDTNPNVRPGGIYNIFSMFADGSGVTQIRSSNNNEIDPAVSIDGTKLAYVANGTLDTTNGLDNPTTSNFNLFVFDLTNGGQPLSLTQNNNSGFIFTDVRHPTWAPGGTLIAFAGQLNRGKAYHLFTVDTQTGVVIQITGPKPGFPAGIESNDFAPSWSPDGSLLAFTSNASGFSTSGPIQASGLNPQNQNTLGDSYQEDIWVMSPNAFFPNPHRVTNSSSMTNGKVSSNKNPAWSTLRPDPLAIVPSETDTTGYITTSINLLAFASTRANTDPNNPTQANDNSTSFDIYFIHASIGPDPVNVGYKTVTTPESVGNAPIKLQTTSPGKTFDPNLPIDPSYNDPTFSFDPTFSSNEDFPAWPQYISSYRIAFQSDRQNNLNIWASTIFDINAPSLLKYDAQNNEIVHVARDSAPNVSVREVDPGEKVRFRVRGVDYETGIESMYIQIKDPNSQPKSADQREHKVFYFGPGYLDTGPARVVNCPYELDSQAINPSTYEFRTPGSVSNIYFDRVAAPGAFAGSLPNYFPGWNQYLPGLDDSNAFSGGAHPPDDDESNHDYTNQGGFWLRMWDDGPISAGGHEPEGEVAGDGVYTNSWVTPSFLPSDWYLDVIIRDNAVDPFDPSVRTNWKIYDNVWGFTTERWQGKNGILYVNDYDSGQRFFQTRSGSFGGGGNLGGAFGALLGTRYNGVPTESWMTEYDPSLIPSGVVNPVPPPVFPLSNFLHTLGAVAYQDALTNEPGGTDPVTARYDQWRILSRGPVPDVVLNSYLGHIETTPPDVIAGGTSPLQVYVAERCVIWHSPYPGDLFVGPGTIQDSDTQVRISAFVKKGGRLFLSGQDLTWGLTLGGSQANAMLAQTFHVNYASDNSGDADIKPNLAVPNPLPPGYTAPLSLNGRGVHPIVMETWYDAFHNYPGAIPNDPPGTADMYIRSTPSVTREYGAPNAVSPDEISFLLPSVLDASDFDATYATTTTPNIVWVTDSSAKPLISKVVYSPLPWEAIQPEHVGTYTLLNRRAEMIHNIGDYLRTGRIVGVVKDLNGGGSLKGVFLRALSNHARDAKGNPVVLSTTKTLGDGSYVLNGLDTTGGYTIDAFLPGYITQHGQASIFHGGYQSKLDFFLAQAKPGSITGKITLKTSGDPVAQLIVRATDNLTGATFTAVTQADGTYTILNVPASNYTVDVPKAPAGNIDTLGLGTATTANALYGAKVGDPNYPKVVVAAQQTAQNADFLVTQAPGSISGEVCDVNNKPIAGAIVTATSKVSGAQFASQPTDAQGNYSIPNLDPGDYTVQAAAPGYKVSKTVTATVISKQNTIVNFCDGAGGVNGGSLLVAAPGAISGLVTTSAGVPLAGVTITVTNAAGTVLATTTSGAVQTVGNYRFNYKISSVPSGATVTVTANKSGYTVVTPPANPQQVAITEGVEVQNINFLLDPLHTFPTNQLTLVSAPYDYTGTDITTLLGIPAGDATNGNFAFLTWTNSPPSYISYPTPPADTFHLGVGYFLIERNSNVGLAVTSIGAPANGGDLVKSFNIPLKVGWNLIGDPFPFPLNFLNLKVQGANGQVMDILTAQSGTNPTLGAALWGYENGVYQLAYTLDQWKGYWIRVYDNRPAGAQGTPPTIYLICDPAARQDRAAHADSRAVLVNGNSTGQGWRLQINANAGDKNAAPGYLGVMKGATDHFDRFKMEAPPAVGSQSVKLAFEHNDWAEKSGSYSVDMRAATTQAKTWDFTVTSNVADQPVSLDWPAVATVPGKQDMILTDLDGNVKVNLRTRANYLVPAGHAGVTRHFRVEIKPATRRTLDLLAVNAYLNPGRAQGDPPSSATISYTVTADATVQVSILKGGHPVRVVEQGRSRAAGVVEAVWDLKSDQGARVPADAYTVEVRAQDADGHLVRKVTPLLLVR